MVLKWDTRRTKVAAKGLRLGVLRLAEYGRSSDIGQPRSLALELDGVAPLSALRSSVSRLAHGIPPLKVRGKTGVTNVEVCLSPVDWARRPSHGGIDVFPDFLISNTARRAFRAYLGLGVVSCLLWRSADRKRTENLMEEASALPLHLGSYAFGTLLHLGMLMLAMRIEDQNGAAHLGGCASGSEWICAAACAAWSWATGGTWVKADPVVTLSNASQVV